MFLLLASLLLIQPYPIIEMGKTHQPNKRATLCWQILGPSATVSTQELLLGGSTRYEVRILEKSGGKIELLEIIHGVVFPIRSIQLTWRRNSRASPMLETFLISSGDLQYFMIYQANSKWAARPISGDFMETLINWYGAKR